MVLAIGDLAGTTAVTLLRRHGDTKFVGVGRLWTFEIKFAVIGAATALRGGRLPAGPDQQSQA
jgi:hypothetical protein